MSTTERDAQREDLRERIVEAARDIVSEHGLDALSMRALGLRIGHSPGTIYHYFQDKEELLRTVMAEGFKRLGRTMEEETAKVGRDGTAMERYKASGRGYARFALENTGYLRAMFEIPGVAQLEQCPGSAGAPVPEGASMEAAVEMLRQGQAAGALRTDLTPERAALVGWGLIHGLTSLYVSGHLRDEVKSHEEFMELIESAMESVAVGWRPRD